MEDFCAKKLLCGDIVKHGTNARLKKKRGGGLNTSKPKIWFVLT